MNRFLLLLLTAVMFYACQEDAVIGNDLLDSERLDLNYRDDFEISIKTVKGDSLLVYAPGSTPVKNTYLLGKMNDPVFGSSYADIGLTVNPYSEFTSDNVVLDSAVLVMRYDTVGMYGDTNLVHHVSVFQLGESILELDSTYSNFKINRGDVLIAEKSFKPRPKTNSKYFNPLVDSVQTINPHIRIRLNDEFAQQLMSDSLLMKDSAMYWDKYMGLALISEVEGLGGFLGLDLGQSLNISPEYNAIQLFLTQNDTTKTLKVMSFRGQAINHFEHDYNGSELEQSIIQGGEYSYSQSMAGTNTEVRMPDLSELKGVLINHAELVLTISDEQSSLPLDYYPQHTRFYLSKIVEDGKTELIEDVSILGNLNQNLVIHGGNPSDGKVRLNVTEYVKKLIDEDVTKSLILTPINRIQDARRTVFYTQDSEAFKPKLKITYTSK